MSKAGLFFLLAMAALGGAQAQRLAPGLATVTESAVGVSLIGYEYDEPARLGYPNGVMKLKSTMLSVDYSGTYALTSQWPNVSQGWFVRGEFQYAAGDADYSSPVSGNLNGTENWYVEVRGQLGRDFQMKGYVLAPYVGLGYRYLKNDLRGDTSAGAPGYRRENQMRTASIGLTHRTRASHTARLSTTFEYMHLLKGVQNSRLSDSNRSTGPQRSDVEQDQNSGYGLRLSLMWRAHKWALGPTLTHWNINDSESVNGLVEPKNKTTEFGFKTVYHF